MFESWSVWLRKSMPWSFSLCYSICCLYQFTVCTSTVAWSFRIRFLGCLWVSFICVPMSDSFMWSISWEYSKSTVQVQGAKLFFFSDSHLASKFFKVVANSKKVRRHFERQTKPFFYPVSVLDRPSKIKLRKRSLTCHKVDTRMDDIQRSSSPKAKIASSYRSRCVCCVLDINLTRKFAADLFCKSF